MKNREIIFELEGKLETVQEINAAITEATGDPEPWFEEDDTGWIQFVEYKDGKTLVLAYM